MQYAKNISRKRFFLITYCFVILNGNKNKTNKKSLHCQNIAAVSLHANDLKKKSPLSVCYTKNPFLFHWKSNVQKHSLCHFDSCLVKRPGSKWCFIFIYLLFFQFLRSVVWISDKFNEVLRFQGARVPSKIYLVGERYSFCCNKMFLC